MFYYVLGLITMICAVVFAVIGADPATLILLSAIYCCTGSVLTKIEAAA